MDGRRDGDGDGVGRERLGVYAGCGGFEPRYACAPLWSKKATWFVSASLALSCTLIWLFLSCPVCTAVDVHLRRGLLVPAVEAGAYQGRGV